jgi:hypothetical protein
MIERWTISEAFRRSDVPLSSPDRDSAVPAPRHGEKLVTYEAAGTLGVPQPLSVTCPGPPDAEIRTHRRGNG